MTKPRVVVLRGHSAHVGELRPWDLLLDEYDIHVVTTSRADQTIEGLRAPWSVQRTRRSALPRGRLGALATSAIGDRYRGLEETLQGADIVHSAELAPWFAAQPAALKANLGYRLVLTVWETIPFVHARSGRTRASRALTLAEADLFLAMTERARRTLLLEGAAADKIVVAPPGIDTARFAARQPLSGRTHQILSPGRLVWEKGHQDVMRALTLLPGARLWIAGAGREGDRLRRHAEDLRVADRVEVAAMAFEAMPEVFARSDAVVLASLATPLWEEQFGLVLVEAMAAGVPLAASRSGAIPEVLAGSGAMLFDPGDWIGLARLLADGPLANEPGARAAYPREIIRRYSVEAAAERIDAAYRRVLGA